MRSRRQCRSRFGTFRSFLITNALLFSSNWTSEAANLRGRRDGDDSNEHRISPRATAGFLSFTGGNYQYTAITDTHHIFERKGTQKPVLAPVTYEPGVFTKEKRSSDNMILLSNGLSAKPIAWVGKRVRLTGRRRRRRRWQKSKKPFHKNPDAAAVFPLKHGGWLYVSNAENDEGGPNWDEGGVGLLRFNRRGRVVGYRKLGSGASHNCGGGVTPWNSWISGEEVDGGQMSQFDPYGVQRWRYTAMGKLGKYESFAYDNETKVPTFYSTRDGDAGLITRFTPNQKGYECYSQLDDYDRWCTLDHGNIDYLITNQDGSIEWTTDLNRAMTNSERFHTNVEGINVHHGVLYFTAKEDKVLFTVNLRAKTYKVKSTVSRGFEEQPDQILRIKGDESGDLYFCEDGGHHPGLHVMKKSGQMYTVLEADKRLFRDHKEETTGVATSPDAKHLYVSFQHVGRIYDVTRDDGRPFTGDVLRVKYHDDT